LTDPFFLHTLTFKENKKEEEVDKKEKEKETRGRGGQNESRMMNDCWGFARRPRAETLRYL